MGRYFSSFFITTFFYLLLLSSLLYSFNDISNLNQQTKSSEERVKVTLIAKALPVPEPVEQKVIKKEKIVKKETPKHKLPVKKKIVKKAIKKPKKEIVKKMQPQPVKQKIVKNALPQEINHIQKNQIKKQKTIAKKQSPLVDTQSIKIKQNEYYSQIKQTINKHKSYPRIAVKRGIEGDVKIQCILSKYGELLSFKILEGKRVFKRSIAKAIQKTFPIAPPKDLFTSSFDVSLTLQYKLYQY